MTPTASRFNRDSFPKPAFAPMGGRSGGTAAQKRRVLIVEDDFLVSTEIEDSLQNAGYQIIGPATTAEEAIAIACHERPDIVIMDVRLAGKMDGVTAAVEIYREFAIRSIFATAHADADTVSRAAEAKPIAWLQKPYSTQLLVEAVKAALN